MKTLRWWKYAPPYLGDGGIRLSGPGVERVEDPSEADCIVVAQCLFVPFREKWKWTRLWEDSMIVRDPARVVVADCSDDEAIPLVQGCLYWRGGLTAAQLRAYPTAVSAPWPSPDLGAWADRYPEPPRMPVGFCGWVTPRGETTRAVESCRREFGASVDLTIKPGFFGHRHPKAGNHRPADPPDDPAVAAEEREYRDNMFGSLTALCPQSIVGVLRYRVTEAMSASRVPVIVGHDYVLPFADKIPWDECAIQVPTELADETGRIVAERIARWGEAGTLERGRLARSYWVRWLDKDRHPEILATVVRERLGIA